MTEPTIEVTLSMLRAYSLPGWGETNMELLDEARKDLVKVSVLLAKMRNGLNQDESCLESIASTLISRAKERIDICHNELDCEREHTRRGES